MKEIHLSSLESSENIWEEVHYNFIWKLHMMDGSED